MRRREKYSRKSYGAQNGLGYVIQERTDKPIGYPASDKQEGKQSDKVRHSCHNGKSCNKITYVHILSTSSAHGSISGIGAASAKTVLSKTAIITITIPG